MQQSKLLFIYGFAIFAMFFGSGNLVFPISVGHETGGSWLFGFLGLMLTGIFLPFLGFLVIKFYKGSYNCFFNEAGGFARYAIPLFTLSLLGSFGVIPRCITVAHGGINMLFPNFNLFAFSALFSAVSFFLCLRESTIIKSLGKWMSPLLISALVALVICGIFKSFQTEDALSAQIIPPEAFSKGFLKGYQMMDLFAAFFFSSFIFKQIQEEGFAGREDKQIVMFAIKAGLLGSFLLGAIYFGFVFLGSHYSSLIQDVAPEYMLPTIIQHIMGNSFTLFIASCAIVFSCLTTAIALNNIYARYLCNLLKLDEAKFPYILLATTAVSMALSLLNFQGIAAFLAPALNVSYPGLIALTVLCLCTKKYKILKMSLFWIITAAMCLLQ